MIDQMNKVLENTACCPNCGDLVNPDEIISIIIKATHWQPEYDLIYCVNCLPNKYKEDTR